MPCRAASIGSGRASSPSAATRPTSPAGVPHSWIKIKNFLDLEVVIVGWTPGAGRREGSVGSLLLAVPDADGRLRYAGKVGTGFTDIILDQLMAALEPLRTRPIGGRRHGAEDGCRSAPCGCVPSWSARSSTGMDPGPPAPGDELAGAAAGQDCGRSRPGARAMSQVSRRAPCAGVTVRSTGVVYRWWVNVVVMAALMMSTRSVGTRAMTEPPNPPPVIRAPSAPAARAVSTAWSSSGQDTS